MNAFYFIHALTSINECHNHHKHKLSTTVASLFDHITAQCDGQFVTQIWRHTGKYSINLSSKDRTYPFQSDVHATNFQRQSDDNVDGKNSYFCHCASTFRSHTGDCII